ncbi:hypothetical protein [Paraliomyxa miuraensis]|uniref:hypothetical protein n=1 Tax=Paraliomyxa miuraensis TaxID=376150 RepID=UPI002250FF90|nr:hypothetical protein [Paraliomyxa miuraensis]MCX4239373.1 hypothetical protein [Paraliomyxa miuraensis]
MKSAAPAATTELYTFPGVTESLEFGFVVEQMMSDMDDGSFDCDATIPAGLDEHYRVSTLASNGRVFCVLHEFLDADVDGYADLGWGTFLYAPDAVNEIDLQAPHVRVDLYTETEVVDLFERTRSRSALIAGSHRYANSAPSICQGHITGSDGDPYYEADAAHNIDTFYAAGKAIAAHYGVEEVDGVSDFSSVHPGFYALQFHAMGVSTCGSDHVFMSNGDGSPVLTNDGAAQLAIALQQAHSNWSVTYRGDGVTTCNRYGSHNTLSRYYNGVTDNGDNDIANPICSHDGNHPAVSARFIHIEQKRCISGTGCHYGDPDSIRTAAYWVSAVSETFDAPTCTNGIHDGDEGDVDCGGSCPLPCGPSCFDGIANGDEEGIDCGGSCPDACPTCFDGIANGDEEGIDCGGSCSTACPTCVDGIANGDEEGIHCGGSCPDACPTCVDGIANGDEEGIDCGGSCPDACPTCFDGIANGDEEGIDCGGSCPDACGGGACLLPDEGLGCTASTPCCSGTGNCSRGKPSNRVCL